MGQATQLSNHLPGKAEIASDSRLFPGKTFDKALFKDIDRSRNIKPLIAYNHVINPIRVELVKLEIPSQPESLKDRTHQTAGLKLPEIMNPGTEQVAVQREGVGPASRKIVLLKHQHLLPSVGQGNGGCEPTGPRADDNGIKFSHLATPYLSRRRGHSQARTVKKQE